jgi:uncharacterized protein (DUF2062 family)
MKEFLRRKLIEPMKLQLLQGASPKGLALSCALGATFAVFPIIGSTTALCLLLGVVLKLNQPVLQAVNYILYPLQIILVPVFLSLGASLTRSEPMVFNLELLSKEFMAGPGLFFLKYGMVGLHGILAWLLIAPFFAWIIYILSFNAFRRWRTT